MMILSDYGGLQPFWRAQSWAMERLIYVHVFRRPALGACCRWFWLHCARSARSGGNSLSCWPDAPQAG